MDILNYLRMEKGLGEISYKEFYRSIFPSGSLEKKGVYEQGKYTGIIVEVMHEEKEDGTPRVFRHTLTDDLSKLDEVVSRDNFCLMSPISYAGKSRKSEYARELYALAIDMDGIKTEDNLDIFFRQIEKNQFFIDGGVYWGIPEPTYLVCSGTGLHLYYVLEKPIRLFPSVAKELEKLKRRITWQIWTQGASELSENVQYESLYQGFRIVGTVTKKGSRAAAFRYGHKVTLEYLNQSVPEEYRADIAKKQSRLPMEEAKKKYPAWYAKRILQQAPKGTWVCKRALYDWWLRRIREVQVGHRYWSIMTLAVYAKKCAIPYEELVADAIGQIPFLDSLGKGNQPFTKADAMKALEAYNDSYMTYPIDTIVERTAIPIQKNKRNGRPQALHLAGARAIQKINDEFNNTSWRKGNGRPKGSGTKKEQVQKWRAAHPDGRKADCVRDTGLSKPTVYKWWDFM